MRRFIGIIALVAVIGLLAGCDLEREVEKVLGAISQAFLEMSYSTSDDPLLVELTESVGRRIAEVSPRRDMPLKFRVFNTGAANAFALPNGRIYVFRGMLEMTDTEDELAAVLAHEAGHVAGRHSLKQFRLSLGIGLLADLLNLDKRSKTLQTVASITSMLYQLGYSRQQERDADTYGLRLALLANYDPNGSVALFRKFAQEEGKRARWLIYLSTHPPSDERWRRAKEAVTHLGGIERDLPAFAAHTRIADGYAKRGLYRQAMRHYEAALSEQPNHVPALLGLAQAKEAWGEWDEARRLYERVLEREPNNAPAKEGLERLRQTPPTPSSLAPHPSPPMIRPDLLAQVRDEWERIQKLAAQRQPAAFQVASDTMGLGRTLWERLSALPPMTSGYGKTNDSKARITIRFNSRTERQDPSPFDRWQDERRWQTLMQRWDDSYDACVEAMLALHAVTAEWEGMQDEVRQVITMWATMLEGVTKGESQPANLQPVPRPSSLVPQQAQSWTDDALRVASALHRILMTAEQDKDDLQNLSRQVQRAVTALTSAASLLQRGRSSFDWAAELRLIDAQTFAKSALADARALMKRLADKRAEVERALLTTYRTRLSALEEKTPKPIVTQLLAYHLRVPTETVTAVQQATPDAGAAAILLTVAKVQRKDAPTLAKGLDFKGEWLTRLIPERAPSGVKVALRWLTTAWEREFEPLKDDETKK
jgi:Zn-dependent protease with chaperone function